MPRIVTLFAVLAALCLALVPAGCGESNDRSDDVSSALGGEGEKDADTLGKYLRRISQITLTDIAIVEAITANELDKAKEKTAELDTMGEESLAIAEEFEGAKLRDLLTNYSKRISDVAGAYDKILSTPETESDAKFQELGEDLQEQKQRLAVLDEKLQVAMKDVLPADEYKKLQERMKALQDKFDEAAGGGG
jgi:DNA anti-recombination protein RmuC